MGRTRLLNPTCRVAPARSLTTPCRRGAVCLAVARSVAVVFFAEKLNALGSLHWRLFATQDYFDPSGLFLTVMLCVPFMLCAVAMVCHALWQTVQLMLALGREKVRRQRQRQQAGAAVGSADEKKTQ